MSHSLSRRQAIILGLVILAALGLGGYGVARIADKQGLWADTVEVEAGFPEAHDVSAGTPVRLRGVDVGQVVGIDYPDHDGPGAEVTVRMKLQVRYATRLYADASAQIHSSGVFGTKVIAISPGSPGKGPLASGRLRGIKPVGVEEVVAEVRALTSEAKDTAGEAKKLAADARETSTEARDLIREVRTSKGTVAKLLKDDDLYRDLKEVASEAKGLLKRTDKAVGVVEGEMANLKGFVTDGRETMKSVRQGTDAIARMPIIRGYVENADTILVRPAHTRERLTYNAADLFEPGSAILSENGKGHLLAVVNWLKEVKNDKADVVVVAFHNLNDPNQTPVSAMELTKKQSEKVIEFLKSYGVHKLGWTTRRKMTPLGMGMNPSPVVEKEPLPPSNVQIQLFTPQ